MWHWRGHLSLLIDDATHENQGEQVLLSQGGQGQVLFRHLEGMDFKLFMLQVV